MIRSHFGLQRNPFDRDAIALLPQQQEVFDILQVHAQQGGLCLVLGEPGTGKSVLKQTLIDHDPKRLITPVVNRTLHTYHNTLRILCDAFQIEFSGQDHRCERLLVQEAYKIHRAGKMLVPVIDDAHLMPGECLRKLRLLCEDFPRSHNLVLIGQPPLMQTLQLGIHEEIRSRVTYSVILPRLAPEDIEKFLLDQFDRAGLGHNVFTEEAVTGRSAVVRSAVFWPKRRRNFQECCRLNAAKAPSAPSRLAARKANAAPSPAFAGSYGVAGSRPQAELQSSSQRDPPNLSRRHASACAGRLPGTQAVPGQGTPIPEFRD